MVKSTERKATEIFRLSNGVRVVTNYLPFSSVDYCGIAINAGSSDEKVEQEGLAHFVEHTIFKGTAKHKSRYILNRMETIGGELNAFTNKEETVIYTVAPNGFVDRSLALLTEIITQSAFPTHELETEKEVIYEEIDSYLDTPSEAIFDQIEELLFRGSSYAHNILGDKKSIEKFNTKDCRKWLDHFFTADNVVYFYSGHLKPDNVVKIIEKRSQAINITSTYKTDKIISQVEPIKKRMCSGTHHQSHVALGFRLPPIDFPLQTELLLINNILGGPGMNSRLNIALREKKGLVYTVDSSTVLYSLAGGLIIYYGCDPKDEKVCRKIVDRELLKFCDKPLTMNELKSAKRQYLGQMTVSLENPEQSIMSAARSLLCRDKVVSRKELEEKIMCVTPLSLIEGAQLIVPDLATELVIN